MPKGGKQITRTVIFSSKSLVATFTEEMDGEMQPDTTGKYE